MSGLDEQFPKCGKCNSRRNDGWRVYIKTTGTFTGTRLFGWIFTESSSRRKKSNHALIHMHERFYQGRFSQTGNEYTEKISFMKCHTCDAPTTEKIKLNMIRRYIKEYWSESRTYRGESYRVGP